jgi:hypothetical protein
MDRLLLVAPGWQFRALVRAQLIEAGHEVHSFPRLDVALAYLARGGERSAVTVVDLSGLGATARMLSGLWTLSGRAQLLLCGGGLDRALLGADGVPPARVLLRPFSVGDVVAGVERMLACTGQATAQA